MANANNKGMQYYTIPGASNSKAGHPLLLKATAFRTFTTSDMLSLCFSLTSVVVILSIMTSRMQEQDFRRSLPLKLVFGLTTVFFAVAAMMVAFAATLMLVIRQRLHWAANLQFQFTQSLVVQSLFFLRFSTSRSISIFLGSP
jgi:hypothetical protein